MNGSAVVVGVFLGVNLYSDQETWWVRLPHNNASLSFGRTSAGIVWFFWGALRHYLCTLCVCIHLIKSLLTDDWALSIVVILPRLVKVCNFFKRNRVSRTFKNPSVQCDFHSGFLWKHKTLITLGWGLYLTSKGHFWRLHFFQFFNENWDFLINFTKKS